MRRFSLVNFKLDPEASMKRRLVLQGTALGVMKRFLCPLIISLLIPLPSLAIGPMSSFQDLVAGDWDPGLINGVFYSSRFNNPCGMAINPEGTKLYVADRGNHCVRMVDFEHANQVSTVAGTGQAGFKDGSLSAAVFNLPNQLAVLPDDQIAVSDEGNSRIRLINLKTKTVSTLAGNGQAGVSDGIGDKAQVGIVGNMVYLASQGKLFFTQPDPGAMRALDLKTHQVTTLFQGKAEIPKPAALCGAGDRLYVANQAGQEVYEGVPVTAAGQAATFNWNLCAHGEKIESLAWAGKILYAVQRMDTAPLARLLPQYQPVTFVSVWGKTTKDPLLEAFFSDIHDSSPMALIPDPQSERKLFFSHPQLNIVTSYREMDLYDLQAPHLGNTGGLLDYEYPWKKPPHTFRIILFGDSRSAGVMPEDPNPSPDGVYGQRSNGICKRLEETLNMMACLWDVPTRFEVFNSSRAVDDDFVIWSYYTIPDLAKKFDVDLVMCLYPPDFLVGGYFQKPLTDEGIPSYTFDPEFILKPVLERTKGTPRKFLDLLLAKKYCLINPINTIQWMLPAKPTDPELVDCAAQMISEPVALLKKKLNAIKTSQGNPVRLEEALFTLPGTVLPQMSMDVFKKVCEKAHVDYFDLSPEMKTFRVSFYPLSEIGGNDHMYRGGHILVASWLAFELIRHKIVPFEPRSDKW